MYIRRRRGTLIDLLFLRPRLCRTLSELFPLFVDPFQLTEALKIILKDEQSKRDDTTVVCIPVFSVLFHEFL